MTEIEYFRATNRVKVSAALQIMREVLPGDEYGITEEKCQEITRRLSLAQDELFASYELNC